MSYAIWNNDKVYDPSTLNNDIVLLKLNQPFKFNSKVRNACLPSDDWIPENKGFSKCYVSGWGALKQGTSLKYECPKSRHYQLIHFTDRK